MTSVSSSFPQMTPPTSSTRSEKNIQSPSTVDPSGSKYCGLTIKWNYPGKYVDISMPNSVLKDLERFQHPIPTRPQHSHHKWLAPMYGAKMQYSPTDSTAPNLDKRDITCVQSIAGTFLYIARAVDPTMIVALNEIGADQAFPTTDTVQKTECSWTT